MKIKLLIIIILISSASLFAQSGASLGIGGFTATARGVESVYWNPAQLAMLRGDRPGFEMVLYSLSTGVGNNSFNVHSINKYIGDGESIYLTEKDINDILGMIPDDGFVIDMSANISTLSFSFDNFGFGIENQIYSGISIPKDLYKNMLSGIGQDVYDYSVKGGGYGVAKFKLSYAHSITTDIIFEVPLLNNTIFRDITGGISLSYLQGYGYANIDKGLAKLTIDDNGILPSADFRAKTAQTGSGIGLDIGFGSYTNNNWYVGMVFENVLGSINWNNGAKIAAASFDIGTDPLFIFGDNQLSEIDSEEASTDTSYSISSFSSRLPLNFRLGVAKDFQKYLVNFEIQRYNKITRATLGGKMKFGFFHLIGSIGRGLNNFNWSGAFAFDFKHFYFDLGISSRAGLTLEHSKALFLGSSMRFGF